MNEKVSKEDKYKRILTSWEVPSVRSSEEAWASLSNKLNVADTSKGRIITMSRRAWMGIASAVAVLILGLMMVNPHNSSVQVTAERGSSKVVILPDGSLAALNAGSEITFDEDWSDNRLVSMSGEVFFEVKKGQRFTVNTKRGSVEVLGTSFDVFARNEKFEVKCFTGKVKVSAEATEVIITPGESAVAHVKTLEKAIFELNRGDWRSGEIFYSEEPLQNVIQELERQFNVVISAPSSEGRVFTGSLNNKDLQESLDVLCLAMQFSSEIKGDMTVVLKEMTPQP